MSAKTSGRKSIVVQEGLNYGWGHMEGTHDGTLVTGDGTLVPGLTLPIIELGHSSGVATVASTAVSCIAAARFPSLYGKYVFADLGQGFDSSAIFYAIVDPDDPDGDVGDVFEFKLSRDVAEFRERTAGIARANLQRRRG